MTDVFEHPRIGTLLDELGFCPECHTLVRLVRSKSTWPQGFLLAGEPFEVTEVEPHQHDGKRCPSWGRPAVVVQGDGWISWTIGKHGVHFDMGQRVDA